MCPTLLSNSHFIKFSILCKSPWMNITLLLIIWCMQQKPKPKPHLKGRLIKVANKILKAQCSQMKRVELEKVCPCDLLVTPNQQKQISSITSFTGKCVVEGYLQCGFSFRNWRRRAFEELNWKSHVKLQQCVVSRGPNSGSCWTEPVFVKRPTVISSVGTGGWAQAPALPCRHHWGRQTTA